MKSIPLYRYRRADGSVKVSLTKPSVEYTDKLRLVADDGKALTKDSVTLYPCIDVDSSEGWYEVDAPAEYLYAG